MLILHWAVKDTSLRQPLDFTMHFLGGAAIAFFVFHALDFGAPVVGHVTLTGRLLFSFALACTAGLFWEFGEFFSDLWFRTYIQWTIRETMRDLLADAAGALACLAVCWLVCRFRRGSDRSR
jgi:hypothetical protein